VARHFNPQWCRASLIMLHRVAELGPARQIFDSPRAGVRFEAPWSGTRLGGERKNNALSRVRDHA